MGLLSTIRDALALPSLAAQPVPYESPWASPNHLLPVITTQLDDRRPVTRALAMSIPALNRARRIIVGSIARCPLEATRADSLAADQPRWLSRTDGPVSPFHRMLWTVDDLLFYGWSLWAVDRDAAGQVIAADRIPIDQWAFNNDGAILYDGQPVDSDSVVLIPGVDDGILSDGTTIRYAARLEAASARAAETPMAHTELHQTGGEPLSNQEIEKLVSGWIAARRSKDGPVSFTNQAIEVKTHGSFDSSLIIEGRAAAAVDIARLTGIPAILLDAASADGTMRYSNVDARNTELVDFCLAPYMAAIAARLGMDDVVPRGVAIRFNINDLTDLAPTDVDTPDDDTEETP